jgi:RNA polymerase sigma factor (TIGR02999 family)
MAERKRLLKDQSNESAKVSNNLMPALYEELRAIANRYVGNERAGLTIQATELVHEAFMRLTGNHQFENKSHFIAAASQAMRRILVEAARKRKSVKHGGHHQRNQIEIERLASQGIDEEILALDDALQSLASTNERGAKLIELRFFGGMTLEEAAECMNISKATADRDWRYSRAWLLEFMNSKQTRSH